MIIYCKLKYYCNYAWYIALEYTRNRNVKTALNPGNLIIYELAVLSQFQGNVGGLKPAQRSQQPFGLLDGTIVA